MVGALVFFCTCEFSSDEQKKMFGSPIYIRTLEFEDLTITRRAHGKDVES